MSVTTTPGSVEARAPVGMVALVREIAVIGIAGLLVGIVVVGLGGRIFMRIAGAVTPDAIQGATTEAGARIGEITVGGTLAIVIFVGIPAGIIGAALAVIYLPWLSWAKRWRGVAFGVVLFALASASSDVMNPDNIDFLLIRNGPLMVALIFLLFIAFGVSMVAAVRTLDRRLPIDGSRARAGYATIAVLGIAFVGLMLPLALFTSGFCSCDPPVVASSFALVAGAGTVLTWFVRDGSAAPTVTRIAKALGYGGLAGTVVFGLIRAVGDASEIAVR
jgi:hypothetical protein